MTKLKSKKMTKSTFAIIIMAIAMVAMLAFGGTYAYFTAQAKEVESEITMGHVHLTSQATEKFTASVSDVLPGDEILTGGVVLTVDTSSNAGDWLAITIDVTGDKATALGISVDAAAIGSGWTKVDGYENLYIKSTKVTGDETILVNGFELDAETVEDNWIQGTHDANSSVKSLMGAQVTITINAASIQGDNVDDIAVAQDELAELLNATEAA